MTLAKSLSWLISNNLSMRILRAIFRARTSWYRWIRPKRIALTQGRKTTSHRYMKLKKYHNQKKIWVDETKDSKESQWSMLASFQKNLSHYKRSMMERNGSPTQVWATVESNLLSTELTTRVKWTLFQFLKSWVNKTPPNKNREEMSQNT